MIMAGRNVGTNLSASSDWNLCWEVTAVIVNYIAWLWKINMKNRVLNNHKLLWNWHELTYISTNCSRFCLKCTKSLWADPTEGAYSAPPDPLAVWGWVREFFVLCTPSRNPGYAPENVSNYSNLIINMGNMRRQSIADVHRNVISSES